MFDKTIRIVFSAFSVALIVAFIIVFVLSIGHLVKLETDAKLAEFMQTELKKNEIVIQSNI